VSATAGTFGDKLEVGRWLSTYVMPANHPDPDGLRRALDAELSSPEFSAGCRELLAGELDPADSSVWRIRRLSLDLSANGSSASHRQAAQAWTRQLGSQVQDLLTRTEHDESCLRFPSLPAYLAQFVFDVATGLAWGKWYYEEFADLSILSASQAIRTALVREGVDLPEVLRLLAAARRLEAVLRVLENGDARLVYEACFACERGSRLGTVSSLWVGAILDSWNAAPLPVGPIDETSAYDALRLLVRIGADSPAALKDREFKAALDALLALRSALGHLPSLGLLGRLMKYLTRGDLQAAAALIPNCPAAGPALAFLAAAMDGDANWGLEACAVLLADAQQSKFLSAACVSPYESLLSFHAGVFLVGPSLDELRLDLFASAMTAPYQSPDKAAPLVRHLVALKCLGADRADEAKDDPALRLFSGFHGCSTMAGIAELPFESLDVAAAERLLPSNDHELSAQAEAYFALPALLGLAHMVRFDRALSLFAAAAMRHFTGKLYGFTGSSPQYVYENFLAGLSTVRRVEERLEVSLAASPLSLVLRMSGLYGTQYAPRWLKGWDICLLPPQE
jgi:hypothetical protein